MNDARSRADTLAAWASEQFGGTVAVEGEPSTASQGMDNAVHFVQLGGDTLPAAWQEPLVLRVQPDVDRFPLARDETLLHDWCGAVGLPAPRVLWILAPGELLETSVQVMQRVPGEPMLDSLVPTVWRAPAMMRALARLHVQLHRAPVDAWPLPSDAPRLARRRLQPVPAWAEALRDPELDRILAQVERLVPELDDGSMVACHGDFHPLNILVRSTPARDGDATAWIIDWTDGALGDRHGDVARTQLLFRVAAVAATSSAERLALRVAGPQLARLYLRTYDREWPLDRERLARWEIVHLLHGWAQVRALHAGIIGRDRERDRVPPALADWLRTQLERRLTG